MSENREARRLSSNSLERCGRFFRNLVYRLVEPGGREGTWIDVGAHSGETTLRWAERNPGLKIYAVEPNLRAAFKLMGRAPNYLVVPMAIAETDGFADFYVNAFESASSLLPFNERALESWIGGEELAVNSVTSVPTIRLDTLMTLAEIQKVNYLKVDTQGMDLAVVRSAGSRLRDVAKITLEVDVKEVCLYSGAPSKGEVVDFLSNAGFDLVKAEKQTHGQEENLTFIRRNDCG